MSSDLKENKPKKGIGFTFAFRGIGKVWREERNFRIHVFIALSVIAFGIYVRLSMFEWVWVLFCIGLVLTAEMINSALEALLDHIFVDYHEVAEKAKDMSAGAVLVAALCAAMIGLIIFLPKIYAIFF